MSEIEVVHELYALISSAAAPDFFTEQELAIYLRLVDKEGKPITAGIKKWAARAAHENPLPRCYVGDKPRFYRPEVIQWVKEETRRKNMSTADGIVTLPHLESNNPSALTASAP